MYTIRQLSMISGLTDRTLRSHLKSGLLRGSKTGGIWQFSEEQVQAFLSDPAVRPGIRAKQNAILYDFQAGFDNTSDELCILLRRTVSREEAGQAAEFFCREANGSSHIRFSYTYEKGIGCFLLKGGEEEITRIMASFYRL